MANVGPMEILFLLAVVSVVGIAGVAVLVIVLVRALARPRAHERAGHGFVPPPHAVQGACVVCGARPLSDPAGRIAGWTEPMSNRPDDHQHRL